MSKKELESLPGVGEKIADKLVEAGCDELMTIATMSIGNLVDICDIGEKTAAKIIESAKEISDVGNFKTGMEKLKMRENVGRISTGSAALNELLGGGIETQCISEFYGAYGSSKTQIALQTSVNVQKPKKDGGLSAGAIFIDTENTFIPERVVQMAKAQGMDPEKVLKNIFVARAFNSDHQILLAEKAEEVLKNNKVGLIIVDSLTSLFRSDYIGRGELAPRQQRLNRHMHVLHRLSTTYNVAILVTNQVMSRPDVLFGDPTVPIGGHIVGHQSAFRVYIRKSKKNSRVARLVDCPYLPEGEAVFKITENGVEDIK